MIEKLVTKLQYRDFEPGEFCNEAERDFTEAVSIIRNFPWEVQRKNIQISLTNPSVSIQTESGNYLKLALYYNGKFVLYYFDGVHLYTHSFHKLEDSFSLIEYFFIQKEVDIDEFKKEPTWLKALSIHFISQDFVYTVVGRSFFSLIDNWTKSLLVVSITFIGYFFLLHHPHPLLSSISLLLVWFLLGGVNFILTLNYYLWSGKKFLQLSRGADNFLVGMGGRQKEYKKNDVDEIVVKKNKSSRAQWNYFTVTYIFLKDGTRIKVPSILLKGEDIAYKIPQARVTKIHTVIPYCKNEISDWPFFD